MTTTISQPTDTHADGMPKSIKIWANQYKVVKQKDPKLREGNNHTSVLGLFSAEQQKITLSNTLINSDTKRVETLIHEILHAIAYSSNVFHGVENKFAHEEHVVDTFANGVTLVLKDNPALVNYIKEILHG